MTEEWEQMAIDVDKELKRPKSRLEKLKETVSQAATDAKKKASDVEHFAKYDYRLDPLKQAAGKAGQKLSSVKTSLKEKAETIGHEIAENRREKAEIKKLQKQAEAQQATQWKYREREMRLGAHLEQQKAKYASKEQSLKTKLHQKNTAFGNQFGTTFGTTRMASISFPRIGMTAGKKKTKTAGITLGPVFRKTTNKKRRRTTWI